MTEPHDPAYAAPPQYTPPPPQGVDAPQPRRQGGAGLRLAAAALCTVGAVALAAVPHTGGAIGSQGSMVTAAQVGLGILAFVFLLSAAFRGRREIATSTASAYRSYQDSAPARAEAAQRARETAARYATAATTVAAGAAEAFREHRANRDVPPSDTYSQPIYDYPDFEPDTNTDPVPPTVAQPPTETSAPTPNDDDGWDF